jgi:AcrR family transcriptional regulator
MSVIVDTKSRTYRMDTRQQGVSATRAAVLRATADQVMAQHSLAITLSAVADQAGVTVKTVLRHFGSREALLDAAWSLLSREVAAERAIPANDPEAALANLVEHYERRGDLVLGLFAEERHDPRARRICDCGRMQHRQWVEEVFGAGLPLDGAQRSRLVDALVVATDLYSWKLLRRDRKLALDEVRDRISLLCNAVLAAGQGGAT